ncbi:MULTISPECIES: hypothetical protein [unclassified Pseudomonas]|uniref:hypothetical protein n=1 Tax=unclassified Pseudomonas TaxID=196821 RepID=UPI00224B203F|nr:MULTISPECIES: hypothetical protein [unclassified Pseudomonas]MCX2816001.1 hypothetical protein [Pseudomonas sp. DCB_E]MCX9144474.1 hypothetical protein [Pseudomonas sp. DCB_Q]
MNIEQQLILLAHLQFTARHFIALRCSLDKLIELVRYSIGEAAPAPDQIRLFLLKESTQKTLELEYESALWQSADYSKSWRLICLATTADPQVAARLLARRPPSSDCCAFCFQDERGVMNALKPELDIYGNQLSGIYLHRQCERPWKYLRDLVSRAGVVEKTKESLL